MQIMAKKKLSGFFKKLEALSDFSLRGVMPLPALLWIGFTLLLLIIFVHAVDLKPTVDEAFFFSSEDPQFKADKIISGIFPQPPQIIIGAKGDIHSPEYAEQVGELSNELADLPEVFSVQSLTRGPDDLEDAFESPLWKRVLISEDREATFISVFVKDIPPEFIVPKLEKIRNQFHKPEFQLMISGAPYIMELISRNLLRDLQVFSVAAFLVFGLVLFIIFRSIPILLGTLIACLNSSTLTLILARLFHIPIGPLTANLSTMVFVLTLSPMVFLTFNWKRLYEEKTIRGAPLIWEAVKVTVLPSFWSMATTFAGFVSLLFVQATPMRHLGVSGAIGTFVAFAAAYTIYPWFLQMAEAEQGEAERAGGFESNFRSFFTERHPRIVFGLMALTLIASMGLWKINTDPNLLSYFKKGSELRNGLEYMDRNGGSSPLKIVVADRERVPFNTGESYVKLWKLHEALEKDPSVGNVVSLPIVLAEAKRSPLTFVISTEWLLKMMESPRFGEVAKYFITTDRKKAFFLLGMRESGRNISRLEVIERIKKTVEAQGFAPALVGGVYILQGKLSQLVSSSLISGVLLLIFMFVVMGWGLSHSVQVSAALLASLSMIPVCLLGLIGYLKFPLDVIAAPAANLAIGMGVDAMIYLAVFARRTGGKDGNSWEVWSKACSQLWQPIGTSLLVICSGFGIFMLSNFPPTQRFGFSVIFGSMASAAVALFFFPWLASLSPHKGNKSHVD